LYRRNLTLYLPYQVVSVEGLMHGLYLLWWVQERHISAVAVATILAAGDFVLMTLEVPTGRFADRFGHRTSMILGSMVQVLGMLWCWLGQGMSGLLAASLLVALGDAFRSGADQAFLYRTCVALDRETEFQRIEARARAVKIAAMVGLILAGGGIVSAWGFATGWLAEASLCTIGLVIACAMVEPPACVEHIDTDHQRANEKARVRIGLLVPIILPVAFLASAASAGSFLAQTIGHGDPQRLTALVAIITLAEAAGSALAMPFPAGGLRSQIVLGGLGLLVLALCAAFPATFLIAVVALAFLDGLAHPVRAAAIQRLAPDRGRARAASIASACDMAFKMVALPLAGFWRGR
jgi:MFS family permease